MVDGRVPKRRKLGTAGCEYLRHSFEEPTATPPRLKARVDRSNLIVLGQ